MKDIDIIKNETKAIIRLLTDVLMNVEKIQLQSKCIEINQKNIETDMENKAHQMESVLVDIHQMNLQLKKVVEFLNSNFEDINIEAIDILTRCNENGE